MKKILSVILCVLLVLGSFGCGSGNSNENGTSEQKKYENALALLKAGDYKSSFVTFRQLNGYKDSVDYLSHFKVCYDKKIVYGSDGKATHFEYTYDSNGYLTKEVKVGSYGYEICYTYDCQGNKIREIHINYRGETYKQVEYSYDHQGNLIKKIERDKHGNAAVNQYTYDSNNTLVEKDFINGLGYVSAEHSYTYDDRGYLVKEIATAPTGVYDRYEYGYDSIGNLVEVVESNGSDSSARTTRYTYDNLGNVVKKVETDKYDVYTTEYEYTEMRVIYDGDETRNSKEYQKALDFLKSGNYEAAFLIFRQLNGYKDSVEYLSHFKVCYNKLNYSYPRGDDIYYDSIEYLFDDHGNMVMVDERPSREYTYDANGNAIKIVYDDYEKITIEQVYNSHGDVVKIDIYDSNGEVYPFYSVDGFGDAFHVAGTSEYTYDNRDNVVQAVFTRIDGEAYTTEYTYDNHGHMMKTVETGPNGYMVSNEYTYDNCNNIVKEVFVSSHNDSYTREYICDNFGNSVQTISPGELFGTHNSPWEYEGIRVIYVP